MIQLQYEQTGSATKAIWSDLQPQMTASQMTIALTSSFEGNYKEINVDVTSNKSNAYGGWILFDLSSSLAPTSSGHYTANIYEVTGLIGNTWAEAIQTWAATTTTWADYAATSALGRLIITERVFVSGSDYDVRNTYENQELSYYNVYHG